jgi:hypothetical protein
MQVNSSTDSYLKIPRNSASILCICLTDFSLVADSGFVSLKLGVPWCLEDSLPRHLSLRHLSLIYTDDGMSLLQSSSCSLLELGDARRCLYRQTEASKSIAAGLSCY